MIKKIFLCFVMAALLTSCGDYGPRPPAGFPAVHEQQNL